ncbi:Pleckstrin homology domain-containing family G member, partial [Schistosoma japonicum]
MSKQSNCDLDSTHKQSTFNLLNKKWNVLRTGVLWAQRLKSVKPTKTSNSSYSPLNNNKSCNHTFISQNDLIDDQNNSTPNNNVNAYNYTPQRTVSSVTKLNANECDYMDKLQKRDSGIKHCSSTKRLVKTFSSSTNVNTINMKSKKFDSTNDLRLKSPTLLSSKFHSSMYESNKDFKEVRFICKNSIQRNSTNFHEIVMNTDTTTNNKPVVKTLSPKISCGDNHNTINKKESINNDSTENTISKIITLNGIWSSYPYSPLPSPDIYQLDSDLND